jgi:FMN-dependent NADH-azoreductase
MYNFTIPSQLKAWIDRILVAGKTFRYGASGPEGLAGNKRVIIAISRGGSYGAGAPAAALEHTETYLRGILGFIGVTNPDFIVAEGLLLGPQQREKSMQSALQAAGELHAA